MTYKEAKKIQSIVWELNEIDGETSYTCSVESMGKEGQYYCYLYSEKDSFLEFLALYKLADGIHAMISQLCWMPDRTAIEVNNKFVQSIRMW